LTALLQLLPLLMLPLPLLHPLAQRWMLVIGLIASRSARWTAGCWHVVATGHFLRW
jgi:hypothetical protein